MKTSFTDGIYGAEYVEVPRDTRSLYGNTVYKVPFTLKVINIVLV